MSAKTLQVFDIVLIVAALDLLYVARSCVSRLGVYRITETVKGVIDDIRRATQL